MRDLNGCIDAMGCQREIARQITQGGADYVLAVKENRGQPDQGIRGLFEGAEALGCDGVPYDHQQTVDQGYGRVARWECWVITAQDCLGLPGPQGQWPQLQAAVRVVGRRRQVVPANPATTSAAWPAQRSNCWRSSEATGASRTRCTGLWT